MVLGLVVLLAVLHLTCWGWGFWAIQSGDVPVHRERMVQGGGLLLAELALFWGTGLFSGPLYGGGFNAAYGLLWWVHLGLGTASCLTGSLAYWAMVERAWDLHRRSGMFAFLSGCVASLLLVLMAVMILFL